MVTDTVVVLHTNGTVLLEVRDFLRLTLDDLQTSGTEI